MSASAGSLRGWGVGVRAAGAVFALGYLLGLVRGPLLAVVGGLALLTLGRCVGAAGSDDLFLGGSLAVLAIALQAGGFRWETLDLAQLRGAQAVLGPSLLVGPAGAAAGCWLALGAGAAALSVWLATARHADPSAPLVRGLWFAEAAVGSLALVTVFWGGSIPRGSFGGAAVLAAIGQWLLAIVVVGGAAVAGALWLGGASRWRGRVLAGAAVAAVAALALTSTAA